MPLVVLSAGPAGVLAIRGEAVMFGLGPFTSVALPQTWLLPWRKRHKAPRLNTSSNSAIAWTRTAAAATFRVLIIGL